MKGGKERGRQKRRWEDGVGEWTGLPLLARLGWLGGGWGIVADSSVVPRRPSKIMG